MKKLVNLSLFYAILAMIFGVFYREFTKFNHFTGKTTLSIMHTHLFALGMLFFLIIFLLDKQFQLHLHKRFNAFLIVYQVGLLITISMFLLRGVLQVLNTPLSSGLNGAISGISGIGHALLAIGLILFFIILKSRIPADKRI